ncbi:hypothetical protein [Nocardia thailandica]
MDTTVNRLTADDDLFLKLHSLYPDALVNQLAWRFAEPLPRAVLDRFHAHLAAGFLGRKVVRARVPLARPYWVPSTEAFPLHWDPQPVTDVVEWFSDRAHVSFDPARGLVWRLAASPTADGGTVVSLATSHVASDGGAVLFAVGDALERLAAGTAPARAGSSGALVGAAPARPVRADLADAASQGRAVVRGVRAAVAARAVSEPTRHDRRAADPVASGSQWTPSDVIVQCELDQWRKVAAEHGGTVNGLLVALGAGLFGRSGRLADGAELRVDIPNSRREDGDPRANATTGLPIAVRYTADSPIDLAAVRASIKRAALAYGDPATTPPLQHLQPVQMILPRAVLHRFARTAKAPECLCTNLGESAAGVADFAGRRAAAVLMRPVITTNETDLFRRVEVGVNLSFCTDGELVTLAVTGADPDRFPTRAALRAAVTTEFAVWGLDPIFW